MRTLIIYDNTGHILAVIGGDAYEPVGVPYMWVEVPADKYIVGVDVSNVIHTPVYEDVQAPDIAKMKDALEQIQSDTLTAFSAIAELYELYMS